MGTRSSRLRIRLLFRVLKRRREDGKSHSSSDRERSKGNPGHVALPFRGSPSTHSAPIWFREESFIFGQVRNVRERLFELSRVWMEAALEEEQRHLRGTPATSAAE